MDLLTINLTVLTLLATPGAVSSFLTLGHVEFESASTVCTSLGKIRLFVNTNL